jgi:hypothetical protein
MLKSQSNYSICTKAFSLSSDFKGKRQGDPVA